MGDRRLLDVHRATTTSATDRRHRQSLRVVLLGMVVSPVIGFGLDNVWPTGPPAEIEWTGDNDGTVNVYPHRCEPAGLSAGRSTVSATPDESRLDARPVE